MRKYPAFTLLEIMITISIVLILATAAVLQTSRIQNLLKFNNTFQKMVLLVQQARNLAFTEKEAGTNFGVYFEGTGIVTGQQKIYLFADRNANGLYTPSASPDQQDEKLENPLAVPVGMQVLMWDFTSPQPCGSFSEIVYETGTGNPMIFCNSAIPIPRTGIVGQSQGGQLEIKLTHTAENREKCFTVHLLSGAVQTQACADVD